MNPETYGWYQCDEEDYDSNASPEEQAEMLAAKNKYAAELIAGMRSAVATVPPYCERPQTDEADEERALVSMRAAESAEFRCISCFSEISLQEDCFNNHLCDHCAHGLDVAADANSQRAYRTCEHGTSLSLCPACSDLA